MSAALDRLAALPPARGRDEIAARLFELFREKGYEGASLTDIARVTGLRRPSLYHHFPGGKAEMAEAVVDLTRDGLTASVLIALDAPGDRATKVRGMLEAVRALYDGGRRPCVAASLMTGDAPASVSDRAAAVVRLWIDRLAAALIETGAPPDVARRAAADALARIQGALVVCRALGDAAAFEDALAAVERALITAG